jgi:hypothetical protein
MSRFGKVLIRKVPRERRVLTRDRSNLKPNVVTVPRTKLYLWAAFTVVIDRISKFYWIVRTAEVEALVVPEAPLIRMV